MAENKLFDNWTWNRELPEPFNDPSVKKTRTDISSKYNSATPKSSTLHSSMLSALLAYAKLRKSVAKNTYNSSLGAIGIQKDTYMVAEYPSRTGNLHIVIYDLAKGKFTAGIFENPSATPEQYTLKEDKESGVALFFALIQTSLYYGETEFKDNLNWFLDEYNVGLTYLDSASTFANILCDNLYRRIENCKDLGADGLKVVITDTGNIPKLSQLNIKKGTYNTSEVYYGEFQTIGNLEDSPVTTPPAKHDDFIGKYKPDKRKLTAHEKELVPVIEDYYVIPAEVVKVCKHIKSTSDSTLPMRNFMLRGPNGTGKTEGAKAIAAGLGLPYLTYTCSSETEIFSLLGQYLPETSANTEALSENISLPTLEDIQMDPATAYDKLTGLYNEDITESQVYDKLIEVIQDKALSEIPRAENNQGAQKYKYVDTDFINAMRHGYVLELQEPSVIANPGVLVGLNGLLDTGKRIKLPTGEIINRHPDTVIIITTNSDYEGCRDMNQSVISRMNLIFDFEDLTENEMIERAANITKFTDLSILKNMAGIIKEVELRCKETMITDGSYGFREYVSWVQSYMILGDILDSAKCTILSSVSSDADNRKDIWDTCFKPKLEVN